MGAHYHQVGLVLFSHFVHFPKDLEMLDNGRDFNAFQVGFIQEFLHPFFRQFQQEYGVFLIETFGRGDNGLVQLKHVQGKDLRTVFFGQGGSHFHGKFRLLREIKGYYDCFHGISVFG